jgi:small-conductance mechanosensitive channel
MTNDQFENIGLRLNSLEQRQTQLEKDNELLKVQLARAAQQYTAIEELVRQHDGELTRIFNLIAR